MTNLDLIFKYYKQIKETKKFHMDNEWFNSSIINHQLKSLKNFSKESGINTFNDSFHFKDSEISSDKPWVRSIILNVINRVESNPEFIKLKRQKLIEKLQNCLED